MRIDGAELVVPLTTPSLPALTHPQFVFLKQVVAGFLNRHSPVTPALALSQVATSIPTVTCNTLRAARLPILDMSLVRNLIFCLTLCLWTLLGVPSLVFAQQQGNPVKYPVTVELNGVFPRNETYSPAPVFPFVFAVQNLAAARPTTSMYIDWVFVKLGIERLGSGIIRLDLADLSSDPYFATLWTGRLNSSESAGVYMLAWEFRFTNCTTQAQNWPVEAKALFVEGGSVIFTIEEGGRTPDLVADGDTCPATNVTVGITGMMSVPFPKITSNNGRDVCGVIADTPPPANPCAARINSEVASSISAELTASACATRPPVLTGTGCPPKPTQTPSSSGSRVQIWAVPGVSFGGLLTSLGPFAVGIMLMLFY